MIPRAFWALLLAVLAAGCGTAVGPVDSGVLEARYPGVATQRGHRLTELGPHFWLAGDELLEFICLWPAGAAIEVSAEGTSAERKLLERALAALGPVIGRDFALRETRRARGLHVEFLEGPAPDDPARMSLTAGDAVADCGVELETGAPFTAGVLPARLESASVRIRRARADGLGRVRPLDDVELLATLLHELGHALGYSTHSLGGETVMRLAPTEVRRMARSVAVGRPLRDATLAALYALPSGVVTARSPAPSEAITTLRVFSMLADRRSWGRPHTRSGTRTAEVWWPRTDGARVVLLARRPVAGVAWHASFALLANSAGREALRGDDPSR